MFGIYRFFSIIFLTFCVNSIFAQEITLKSFKEKKFDLSASTHPIKDCNGNDCALLKLQIPNTGVTFDQQVTYEFHTNEYWVYLPTNIYKHLTIRVPNYNAVDIVFADHNIEPKGLTTYELKFEIPEKAISVTDWKKVSFVVSPINAELHIDNLEDNFRSGKLPVGIHKYRITAPYYRTMEGTFDLNSSDFDKPYHIDMDRDSCRITIQTIPGGARIKIDEACIESTAIVNHLIPCGQYKISILKDKYKKLINEPLTINRDTTITYTLTPIRDVVIKSLPTGASVEIDNVSKGRTPISFNGAEGTYNLILKKDGYHDFSEKVKISRDNEELIFNLKKKYFNSTGGYVEGIFNAGSLMAIGADAGAYIYNVNIEFDYLHGLTNSEEIYWNSTKTGESIKPSCYTYKPTYMAVKIGYGILLHNRIRLTPQLGIGVIKLKGSLVGENNTTQYDETYAVNASIGLRLHIAILKWLGISVTPEYSFGMKQGDIYKSISDVSSKVKNWRSGFNSKIGVNVFF